VPNHKQGIGYSLIVDGVEYPAKISDPGTISFSKNKKSPPPKHYLDALDLTCKYTRKEYDIIRKSSNGQTSEGA